MFGTLNFRVKFRRWINKNECVNLLVSLHQGPFNPLQPAKLPLILFLYLNTNKIKFMFYIYFTPLSFHFTPRHLLYLYFIDKVNKHALNRTKGITRISASCMLTFPPVLNLHEWVWMQTEPGPAGAPIIYAFQELDCEIKHNHLLSCWKSFLSMMNMIVLIL